MGRFVIGCILTSLGILLPQVFYSLGVFVALGLGCFEIRAGVHIIPKIVDFLDPNIIFCPQLKKMPPIVKKMPSIKKTFSNSTNTFAPAPN